jgi:hypothetical protein
MPIPTLNKIIALLLGGGAVPILLLLFHWTDIEPWLHTIKADSGLWLLGTLLALPGVALLGAIVEGIAEFGLHRFLKKTREKPWLSKVLGKTDAFNDMKVLRVKLLANLLKNQDY